MYEGRLIRFLFKTARFNNKVMGLCDERCKTKPSYMLRSETLHVLHSPRSWLLIKVPEYFTRYKVLPWQTCVVAYFKPHLGKTNLTSEQDVTTHSVTFTFLLVTLVFEPSWWQICVNLFQNPLMCFCYLGLCPFNFKSCLA